MRTIPEIIEILQGFKDGRKYQYVDSQPYEITNVETLLHRIIDGSVIRIAPELKLVPYGPEDGRFLINRLAMSKKHGWIFSINQFNPKGRGVIFNGIESTFTDLFENFLDITDDPDGVPFGRVVDHA